MNKGIQLFVIFIDLLVGNDKQMNSLLQKLKEPC